jgi:hypothetical protein
LYLTLDLWVFDDEEAPWLPISPAGGIGGCLQDLMHQGIGNWIGFQPAHSAGGM